MKAIILVGGLGTRLREIVPDKPKGMALFAGKPFLEYQLNYLKKQGITEIILCTGYLHEQIENFFGDGSDFGVSITYSKEEERLGTAGAIKNAEKFLKESFLVLNGDTYCGIDFNELIKFHKEREGLATIALNKSKNNSRYGSVILNVENKIINFQEKNQIEGSNLMNSGVYIFEPEVLQLIPEIFLKDKRIFLENYIFPILSQKRKLNGYVWEGYFIDMGVPDSYKEFKKWILNSLCINGNCTVREAMASFGIDNIGTALIVNEKNYLEGIVTDGDIRRYIIKDDDLNKPIKEIMIKNPVTAKWGWPKEKIIKLINPRVRHLPIIDEGGILRDVILSADIEERAKKRIIIRAKAPLRISFAGGGTDIYEYFKEFQGYVLSSTIDKYCKGTLIKREDSKIMINSLDFDIIENVNSINDLCYNGKLDLIKAVIKLMEPDFGFDLYLYSDVPPGTGLGCSASIAAVVAGLINHIKDKKLSDYKLAEIIYKAEREEIKVKGGLQDQYASVFGGFNFIEFREKNIVVYPLRIKKEILEELNSNLFLCYTGKTRVSGDIQENLIKAQENIFGEENKDIMEALSKLKEITLKIKDVLLMGKIEEFGKLLHESWENKKRTNKKISSTFIDEFYNIGIRNGALGGKILGAGGGGYLLFFCSPLKKKQVTEKLKEAGGKILNFNFDSEGLITWNSTNGY